MHGDPPAFAVQDQLHTTEIALNLADPRDRAGRVQHAGCDLIDVLFLSYRKHLPVGSLRAASMARNVAGRPAPIGDATPGNSTASPQRQDGQTHPV